MKKEKRIFERHVRRRDYCAINVNHNVELVGGRIKPNKK